MMMRTADPVVSVVDIRIIARLTDQVDKMRDNSINQRSKIDELRGQRTAVRRYKSYGPPWRTET
jgi:hypothetical protein